MALVGQDKDWIGIWKQILQLDMNFDDCPCMHGINCYDYMGNCVYCGHP